MNDFQDIISSELLGLISIISLFGHTLFISKSRFKWAVFSFFAFIIGMHFLYYNDILHILFYLSGEQYYKEFLRETIGYFNYAGLMTAFTFAIPLAILDIKNKLISIPKKILYIVPVITVSYAATINVGNRIYYSGLDVEYYWLKFSIVMTTCYYFLWHFVYQRYVFSPKFTKRKWEEKWSIENNNRKAEYSSMGIESGIKLETYIRELWRKLKDKEGDPANNYFLLASLQLDHGEIIASFSSYNKVIEVLNIETTNEAETKILAKSYFRLGDIHAWLLNYKKAYDYYEKAYQLFPTNTIYAKDLDSMKKMKRFQSFF